MRHYRARNKCEWCGAANGEPHPVTGSTVVLTTAHVWDDRPELEKTKLILDFSERNCKKLGFRVEGSGAYVSVTCGNK